MADGPRFAQDGLTTEQIDELRDEHVTFKGALAAWTADGPWVWNVWQRGFHLLARRFVDIDEAAVAPSATTSTQWALIMWREISEAVHGPEWKSILRVEVDKVRTNADLRRSLPSAGRPFRDAPMGADGAIAAAASSGTRREGPRGLQVVAPKRRLQQGELVPVPSANGELDTESMLALRTGHDADRRLEAGRPVTEPERHTVE